MKRLLKSGCTTNAGQRVAEARCHVIGREARLPEAKEEGEGDEGDVGVRSWLPLLLEWRAQDRDQDEAQDRAHHVVRAIDCNPRGLLRGEVLQDQVARQIAAGYFASVTAP